MSALKLSLLAASLATVQALPPPLSSLFGFGQQPLESGGVEASAYKCDLPPAIDPSGDGLPSPDELFSSKEALERQIKRHQAIVRVPSICFDDLGQPTEDERYAPFYTLHDVLAETYPVVHKRAKLEKINTFGLLYTIEGSDPSLKPTMLTAHQDVVPVADASTWTHPPFDAYYDGEWLWGRGSGDDKNSMTALLSAMEALLSDDSWTPKRTILLAFGFDEECSGYKGAGSIGRVLTERYGDNGVGIILDEGGLGMIDSGGALYVLPGVTEKGHIDVWLELHVAGGHSSIPLPHTGIGIAAEMVTALEANPYEPLLQRGSPVYNHMSCVARYTPEALPRISELLGRDDLEGVARELASLSRPTQFMIQTSQAVDFVAGGQKINAMPEVTTLGVNYRVAPHDGIQKVQHTLVQTIQPVVDKYNLTVRAYEGDDEYAAYVAGMAAPEDKEPEQRLELRGVEGVRPLYDVDYDGTLVIRASDVSQVAPISPTTGPVWDVFSGTIQHSFTIKGGPTVPVGETMTGNTDTRHYLNLTPHVYRFTPGGIGSSENIHTVDERVRMDMHMDMVKFYYNFVRNFESADLE